MCTWAEGLADRSPCGYIRMSPLGSGSVLNLAGMSTSVPSNVCQRFQPAFSKPNIFLGLGSSTTSMPSACRRSAPISPSIWYGSTTLTGVPGLSRPKRLAEPGDDADVGAGAGGASEIDGDAVGGLVVDRGDDTLPAGEAWDG